jgi:hypothetical protein
LQEEAEIILFGSAARFGLTATQPPLRSKVLEKGYKPTAPVVIALLDGQCASDGFMPIVTIQEACIGNGVLPDFT